MAPGRLRQARGAGLALQLCHRYVRVDDLAVPRIYYQRAVGHRGEEALVDQTVRVVRERRADHDVVMGQQVWDLPRRRNSISCAVGYHVGVAPNGARRFATAVPRP